MTAPTEQHRERARALDATHSKTVYGFDEAAVEKIAAAFAALEAEVRAEQREADAKLLIERAEKDFAPYPARFGDDPGRPEPTNDQCGAGDRLIEHMQDMCSCESRREWAAEVAAAIRATAAPEQEPKP